MVRNLRIGPRLLLMIAVQAIILIGIGVIAVVALRNALDSARDLGTKVSQQAQIIALADSVRSELMGTVYAVNVGSITWPEARASLAVAEQDFEADWAAFRSGLDAPDAALADEVLTPYVDGVREAFRQLAPVTDAQNRQALSLFVSNDLEALVGPFLNALVASTALDQIEAGRAVSDATVVGQRFFYASLAVFVLGVALAALLGFAIYQSIVRPIRAISGTVQRVSEGDYSARTAVTGADELGRLGSAFDGMLNDRVSTLSRAQEENEQLNESVIGLLQAVSRLSQRDLTVRVPVTEDVTGPVADSLNLLTDETAKVLAGVREISRNVALASREVKAQSDRVIAVASQEQVEVEETATRLSEASARMTRIAKLAQASAEAADKAIATTQGAMRTVTDTVAGINGIRDTIREAEKRIKRLGERSQEISGVVSLINTIAERTHILALNASMHAASAGEAGRGFAVVADEVQRLAENARDATSQIATLVSNIQVETADTVTTMNDVISQVVSGSKLAEQAGEQMRETRESTATLVNMVQKIAEGSRIQAQTSVLLRKRAEGIRKSSQDTSAQLAAQSTHTVALVEQARRLLEAVNVFQLPGAAPAVEVADEQAVA